MRMLVKLLLVAGLLLAQKAENLLQSGVKKETVDGNLRGAIEDYKKAASEARGDRALAARALFQLAQCYRKLGDAQARQTFERIIREFGDQPFAGQARAQLASMSPSTGVSMRKLDDKDDYGCSSLSADGSLAGCALGWVREAAVLEIATGKYRDLTQLRKENRFLNTWAISPDGKWVALHTYREGAVQNELAIISTDGAGTLKTLYKHPEERWLNVHAWTPDSKAVLITILGKPRSNEKPTLHTVTIADGVAHPIRQLDFDTQWVPMTYSPDGKWLAISVPAPGSQRTFDVEIWNAADGSRVSSVVQTESNEQVAGWAPDGKSLIVSTSKDGQSSLLRVPIAEGKPAGPAQQVRASIGPMQTPMGIDRKGRLVYSTRRMEINLYSTAFDPQTGSAKGPEVRVPTLTPDRQAFGAWSPDGKRFASWTFDRFDNTESATQPQVMIRDLASGAETIARPEKAFHAFHVPTWSSDSRTLLMMTLEAKPDLYSLSRLDPVTGKVTVLSKPVRVMNIGYMPDWTPDARWMFQRRNDGDVYQIDVATGEEKLLHRAGLRIRNLQASPDGARLAFATAARNQATLEILDVAGGATKSIALPWFVGWGGMIAWSPDSRFLVYGFNEDKQSDLWVVPADGSSAPRKLLPGLKGRASQLAFSPEGKTLTYTRATSAQELWMLEGFLGEVKP